jgi:hypothetical protein
VIQTPKKVINCKTKQNYFGKSKWVVVTTNLKPFGGIFSNAHPTLVPTGDEAKSSWGQINQALDAQFYPLLELAARE